MQTDKKRQCEQTGPALSAWLLAEANSWLLRFPNSRKLSLSGDYYTAPSSALLPYWYAAAAARGGKGGVDGVMRGEAWM